MELDLRSVQRASRRAGDFDPQDAILARRSGEELVERLGLLNFVPEVILDLGSGVGTESRTLAERFSDAYVVGLDICALSLRPQISTGKWAPVTGNANALPFAEATFDLVLANLVNEISENKIERRLSKRQSVGIARNWRPFSCRDLRAQRQSTDI